MRAIEIALKRPFPSAKLKWRRGQGGSGELVYITARDVMDRLDEVFGPAGWQTEFEWIGERMVCQLSCQIEGNWVTKCDGADDTNIEAAKGGLSDSFKRSAVMWGVARYLYYPGAFNSRKEPASWATPEGFDKLMVSRQGKEREDWSREYDRASKDIRGPDTKKRRK